LLDQSFQQHGGADVVDLGIPRHVVHTLPDSNRRCEVIDDVHSLQRLPDGLGIANIPYLEFDFRVQIGRTCRIGPVHLRVEVVQHAHTISFGKQPVGQMGSDEPRAAGYENRFRHDLGYPQRTRRRTLDA